MPEVASLYELEPVGPGSPPDRRSQEASSPQSGGKSADHVGLDNPAFEEECDSDSIDLTSPRADQVGIYINFNYALFVVLGL
jgi:hypothetical protein